MTERRRNARDLLRRARARISRPSRWTRGANARDSRGEEIAPRSPSATRWCLVGAIRSLTESAGDYDYDLVGEALHLVIRQLPEGALYFSVCNDEHRHAEVLAGYNDDHRHADVIALLDRAIAQGRRPT